MGKIIRNGIEYSGSYDNAISINYDNTNSGLNATTVQEGIDEIKEDLKPHANVNPISNLLTTETGYALDATQGKVLDDKISAVSSSLNDLQTGVGVISTNEKVTISSFALSRIGNIAFLRFRINCSESIAQNQTIGTVDPIPRFTTPIITFGNGNLQIDNQGKLVVVNNSLSANFNYDVNVFYHAR